MALGLKSVFKNQFSVILSLTISIILAELYNYVIVPEMMNAFKSQCIFFFKSLHKESCLRW